MECIRCTKRVFKEEVVTCFSLWLDSRQELRVKYQREFWLELARSVRCCFLHTLGRESSNGKCSRWEVSSMAGCEYLLSSRKQVFGDYF